MQKKQAAASNGISMPNSSPYRNWYVKLQHVNLDP